MKIPAHILTERILNRAPRGGVRSPHSALSLLRFAAILGLATAGSLVAQQTAHPVTAALILMLAIIVNGADGGLAAGLITAACASFFYNFFIRFPIYQFGFDSVDDLVPLIAFNIAAGVSGVLSGRLKDRANAAERASSQLNLLLTFSARLQRAITLGDVVEALRQAAVDATVQEHILPYLEQRHAVLVGPKWRAAIACPCAPGVEPSRAVFQPHDVDLHAVADLLAMAIQRCDLLDREAESEAIRRSELLKTALLSSLSHDLRTPIAAISAAATSLNQYGALLEHESRVEMLDTIQTQCRRLDRFTAKLLSLGQLQGGLAPSDMEVIDVADTLGSAIGQVRALQSGRAITKNVEAAAALVWANPAMLEQVLFNILENAVSYTPANTPITVRVTTTPETVEISVADEGAGITAKDLPYIFDRFYRSTNRRDKSGQGLGLSIAKGFIEAFGGTISAKSPFAHGKGTQLCIELPLVKSPVEALLHG